MSDDILKDPQFRHQYDWTPKPDQQFTQVLGEGSTLRMAPVSSPLVNITPWLAPLHK